MPVRIMHVVDCLATGGLQKGLSTVIERLDPAEFEHIVYAMRRVDEQEMEQQLIMRGVRVVHHENTATQSRYQVPALVSAMRAIAPDIVHSRNWPAIEAVSAARLVRKPRIVHSEHGLDFDSYSTEPLRRTLMRRVSFALAHRVFCVSQGLRDIHAARTGFPLLRIDVIRNGVDTDRFRRDPSVRARMRAELGVSPDQLCVGCVGSLTAVKDSLTILRALQTFTARCDSWRLLLIGDGPQRSELRSFVDADPRLRERVRFLGRMSNIPELLNAMDVYVLCSLTEGICNSLLEAMATALPSIATDTGGTPEVLVDGVTGILVRVGSAEGVAEALLALNADAQLRRSMGDAALNRIISSFSIGAMIRAYADLYTAVSANRTAAMAATN